MDGAHQVVSADGLEASDDLWHGQIVVSGFDLDRVDHLGGHVIVRKRRELGECVVDEQTDHRPNAFLALAAVHDIGRRRQPAGTDLQHTEGRLPGGVQTKMVRYGCQKPETGSVCTSSS